MEQEREENPKKTPVEMTAGERVRYIWGTLNAMPHFSGVQSWLVALHALTGLVADMMSETADFVVQVDKLEKELTVKQKTLDAAAYSQNEMKQRADAAEHQLATVVKQRDSLEHELLETRQKVRTLTTERDQANDWSKRVQARMNLMPGWMVKRLRRMEKVRAEKRRT